MNKKTTPRNIFPYWLIVFSLLTANYGQISNTEIGHAINTQILPQRHKPKHKKAAYFAKKGIFNNICHFSDLENRLSNLSKKECGDAFEVFAEAYFNTCDHSWIKEVYPFDSIPYQLKIDLGLTKKDMGIDGLLKMPDDSYGAYQVKYRKKRKSLTWKELSTFIGLSDHLRKKILFTNTECLPLIINSRKDFFAIREGDLDRLTKQDFQAIENWLNESIVIRQIKKIREHQKDAIADIQATLKNEDRATAIMACGTGKTLTSLWLAQQRDDHSILVLLPSLTLIRQTLHCWKTNTSWDDFSFLCVCSDNTVCQGIDEVIVSPYDCDFPVSTKKENVQEFLENNKNKHKVIFSTYQSSHIVAQGMPKGFSFDLGLFDEAHKTASREKSHFAFALKDENIPIKKRLFLTATPKHYNIEKRDNDGNLQIIYSMNDPKTYGPTCHNLSFGAAHKKEIICNYKLIISVVTSSMVDRELLNKGEVNIKGDLIKAKHVAKALALKNAIEKYETNHILTFHNSVKSAQLFSSNSSFGIKEYLKNFNVFHVNGAMSSSNREQIMKEFELSPKAIMTNARCLTEGIDVPEVDMVAFMSPKKSKVDIVQAAGRAMRKSNPNKMCGYILIPLFLQEKKGEDILQAFHRTRFEELWEVLQTMMEQDVNLAEIIYEIKKTNKNNFDDTRLREKIEILAPEINLVILRDAITSRIIDTFSTSFDGRLKELIEFKKQNGHCNIPHLYYENPALGNWVHKQRVLYHQKRLSKDHIKKLENIGFVWDLSDAQWKERFKELCTFKEKKGHCNVSKNDPNKKLSTWVETQRKRYTRNTLSDEQITQLKSIGFSFDPSDEAWNKKFNELLLFKEKYGHSTVPQIYPENKALGIWADTQRKQYNRNILTKKRISKLEKIGFIWNPFAKAWEEKFLELTEFKLQTGHCNVPNRYPKNPSLGKWVHAQRVKMRKGSLSQDRIEKLNALEFSWTANKQSNQPTP